jgi:predicted phosphodiesterase
VRHLVVSDVHANDHALRAVFASVRRKRIDRLISLGDFVGYGAQPNQVIERVQAFRAAKLFIRGNHDRVATGSGEAPEFNHPARVAALWTRRRLSRASLRFLQRLPQGPVDAGAGVLLCHGSPFDEDEYVFTPEDAAKMLQSVEGRIVFFGHTHMAAVIESRPDGSFKATACRSSSTVRLRPGAKYMVNPGSVGQPRDRVPLTSFVIYDDVRDTLQFFRIPYDVAGARRAIVDAGLPALLGDRLHAGT